MERWLSESIKEKAVPRDEYREVLSRLEILEHDVSDIKTDVRELRREMNERFDRVNERFDDMGARFDGRLDDMHHQMIVQTRWLIGSLALIGSSRRRREGGRWVAGCASCCAPCCPRCLRPLYREQGSRGAGERR
jgi:tetrahydromethanopterin S-methyltransferase subunit G